MSLSSNIAKKGKPAAYAAIGGEVFGGVVALRALRRARREDDRLRMINAVIGLAAAVTSLALVVRALRKGEQE